MRTLIAVFIFSVIVFVVNSQVPEKFKYQTVVRNNLGQVISNQNVSLRASIIVGFMGGPVIYQEEHSMITNDFGLVNLEIGGGNVVSGDFTTINWGNNSYFIRIELDETGGTAYQVMGVSQLLSVPYAMYADKAGMADSTLWKKNNNDIFYNDGNVGIGEITPTGRLVVKSDTSAAIDDVIFSVLNLDGDTVLAVYQEGVRIWVADDTSSGTKASGSRGGFAVGGFTPAKGMTNEYLRVTPDSVRVYIEEGTGGTKASGSRGGFAVGGFSPAKSFTNYYFNLEYDSTEIINPSEPRMLWYPNKEAFSAGRVLVESADSVGVNSTALGYESKAMGEWSQAFGYTCRAQGNYSSAIGKNAQANGTSSFAFGNMAIARGDDAVSFGTAAQAIGNKSFAFGSAEVDSLGNILGAYPTNASGESSFAIGYGAKSSNLGTFSIGNGTFASGFLSFAIGNQCLADSSFAMAMGRNSHAGNNHSIALGWETHSTGNASFATGRETVAGGHCSTAMGRNSQATDDFSVAAGYFCLASGHASTAFGYASFAIGARSFVAGNQSYSIGDYSVAMGDKSVANSDYSISIGRENDAANESAIAFGRRDTALGWGAIAIGNENRADGFVSVSIGSQNRATGIYSFAIGNGTSVQGNLSYAIGTGINVQASNAMAIALTDQTGNTLVQDSTLAILGCRVGIGVLAPAYRLELPNFANTALGQGRAYQWDTYSDGRVKTIQKDITYGLDEIMQLSPKSYRHNSSKFIDGKLVLLDSYTNTIGLIAQEVYQLIPEIVTKPVNEDKDLWTMNYEKLIPVMIKGMQEQNDIITAQKEEIELLKLRIEQFESQINRLEATLNIQTKK